MSRSRVPASPKRKPNRSMYILLVILSISYWYCLPMVTQSFLGYNEFRGYDFLFLILIVFMLNKYHSRLVTFFQKDKPGKWIYRFCLWATATYPITLVISLMNGKGIWALVTFVFLFHLWGFAFGYAALRIFVKTRKQCFLLLDLFLLIGAIEALIICLQGLGMLPLFWGPLYASYGERAFSATLGPNRAMPGHVMVLVLAVASAYWRNLQAVGMKRLILASIAALTGLAALGLTGSRTAWTTFAVFCVVSIAGQKIQLGSIAFIVVIAIGVAVAFPDSIRDEVATTYDWRVTSGLSRVDEDSGALEKFQAIDAGRYNHWSHGLIMFAERPWLIPFGGGFNNYHQVSDGPSAHNIYITLVTEVGIVGLFFYLMWLKCIWQESSDLLKVSRKLKQHDRKVFFPFELKPLLIALIVSLFAGEILYPYRPCFAFMGMFLFLCAVMNHPALIRSEKLLRIRQFAPMRVPPGTSKIGRRTVAKAPSAK